MCTVSIAELRSGTRTGDRGAGSAIYVTPVNVNVAVTRALTRSLARRPLRGRCHCAVAVLSVMMSF